MHRRFRKLTHYRYGLSDRRAQTVRLSVAVALCSSLVSGCAEDLVPSTDADVTKQKTQAVIGGTLSEREPVILLRSRGPGYDNSCSGTLVAPNLVLTARHCVSSFTNGDFSCTIDGFIDLSRARSPASAGDMGLPYPPETIGIHTGTVPDFDVPTTVGRAIISPETDTICRNDIAFVILEDELPLETATLRLQDAVEVNEPTTVVGYGLNDRRRIERTERSDVRISAIGFSEFYPVEGNALPRTFALGTSVCPGDSGGPAYSDDTNEVLGVFSFFRGDCESSEARNFFTHVAPFRSVALRAFEEAGYLEVIEPPDTPPEEPPPEQGGAPNRPIENDDAPHGKDSKGGCAFQEKDVRSLSFWWWSPILAALTYRRRRSRTDSLGKATTSDL